MDKYSIVWYINSRKCMNIAEENQPLISILYSVYAKLQQSRQAV